MIFLANGLRKRLGNDLHCFALICTAVAHDCGYMGKSNLFWVATEDAKAKKWNNEGVNENEHVEFAIECFKNHRVFENCAKEVKEETLKILKNAILYTDMTKHERLVQDFAEALKRETQRRDDDDKEVKYFRDWENREEVHLALAYVLHCAYILNGCRPWHVAKKWSDLITEEFCKQGDVEKQLGFKQLTGKHVDRTLKTEITSSEQAVDFSERIVEPLYRVLASALPEAMEPIVVRLKENTEKHKDRMKNRSV